MKHAPTPRRLAGRTSGATCHTSRSCRARRCSIALLLASLATGGSSGAQVQLQGRVRVLAGASTGTPLPGASSSSASEDVWGELRPELSLTAGPPRARLNVDYAFTGALHWQLPIANAISNRLVLGARFETSRTTTLILTADATQSSVYGALLQGSPGEGNVPILPQGNLQTIGSGIRETLTWEPSPNWRVGQSLGATMMNFLDLPLNTTNVSAHLGGSLDRTWRADSLGAEVIATLVHYGATAALGAGGAGPAQSTEQLLLTAQPRWRHDLNSWLTGALAVGGSGAFGLAQAGQSFVGVVGRASLQLHGTPGSLSLELSRLLQPGQLTGQTYFMNAAALRGNLTLSSVHRLALAGSAGYSSASLDLSGKGGGPGLDAVLADLGLTWSPVAAVQLAVRYQFADQIAAPSTLVASTLRHTVTAAVTIVYPTTPATPVLVRLPERVDGADTRPAPALGDPSPK